MWRIGRKLLKLSPEVRLIVAVFHGFPQVTPQLWCFDEIEQGPGQR